MVVDLPQEDNLARPFIGNGYEKVCLREFKNTPIGIVWTFHGRHAIKRVYIFLMEDLED